jgi:hypothetical protein
LLRSELNVFFTSSLPASGFRSRYFSTKMSYASFFSWRLLYSLD